MFGPEDISETSQRRRWAEAPSWAQPKMVEWSLRTTKVVWQQTKDMQINQEEDSPCRGQTLARGPCFTSQAALAEPNWDIPCSCH